MRTANGQQEASLEIRLGAIHALGRLAGDSKRDAGTIGEVLQAYVELNAARVRENFVPSEPRLDIQAALNVLIRQGIHRPISLRRCQLAGSRLAGVNLAGARLPETGLDGADLTNADLSQAYLWSVGLHSATLVGTRLTGADLRSATMVEATFLGATFSGCHL